MSAAMIDADKIKTRFPIPNGSMTILPLLTITMENGRAYHFDWHRYLGPTFLRADGEPLARYPSQRHPVWPAFNAWQHQGRRVDGDGNCIWSRCPDLDHMAALVRPMPGCKPIIIRRVRDVPAGWDTLENVR